MSSNKHDGYINDRASTSESAENTADNQPGCAYTFTVTPGDPDVAIESIGVKGTAAKDGETVTASDSKTFATTFSGLSDIKSGIAVTGVSELDELEISINGDAVTTETAE